MRLFSALALLCSLCIILTVASAQTVCDAERLCADGLCCSKWGYCGTTSDYCCDGCLSQCSCNIPPPPPYTPPPPPSPPPPPHAPTPSGDGVGTIITEELFDKMLLHRATSPCVGGFYTYDAFIAAANKHPTFGMNGSLEKRTRELAAFFAQTAHETTGGWDTAPDGRYSWGYCWIHEGMTANTSTLPSYCVANDQWPCAPGKKYYGRGPIQLSYNYNYGQAGDNLDYNLLENPDQVESDTYVAFETAVWFWMTPQSPKPSCHDVMTGGYTPTAAEEQAGWLPGFGLTTNIINGGEECGASGGNDQEDDRVGYYLHFCEMLGVDPGDNLYCRDMQPYGGLTKKHHTTVQQTFARAALLSE